MTALLANWQKLGNLQPNRATRSPRCSKKRGISGKSELTERPALSALMLKIAGNGVNTVFVERADRFARDSIAAELLIREFQKLDARVIECEGGNDLSDADQDNPTGKLVRQILAAVSEFDKDSIILKLRAARKRKKAATGRCEGKLPYGAREGEMEVIKRIRSMRCKRSGKRMSWRSIAEELNRQDVPTRHGKRWYGNVVKGIAQRVVCD